MALSYNLVYEEIILGRTCCEEAPQFVPACLALIWAIRKAFQCILQGVRFLLAKQTRLSGTSENESYDICDHEDWRLCDFNHRQQCNVFDFASQVTVVFNDKATGSSD